MEAKQVEKHRTFEIYIADFRNMRIVVDFEWLLLFEFCKQVI